jgi:hypothetical protein
MARRQASLLLRRSATLFIAVICVLAAARPDVALAQANRNAPRYEVTGFRDARFGMTESEVRAIARNAFGAMDDEMTVTSNAVDGTTKLIVHVAMLEPGLGEGRVEYIFGYRTHTLIRVDVIWGLDTNPPRNNSAMIAVSGRLQRHFLEFAWANRSVRAGVPIDDDAVLLFGAEDGKNGAVSMVVEGLRYEVSPNGVVKLLPERAAPPRLILSYVTDRGASDVRTLSRGDF